MSRSTGVLEFALAHLQTSSAQAKPCCCGIIGDKSLSPCSRDARAHAGWDNAATLLRDNSLSPSVPGDPRAGFPGTMPPRSFC